MAKTYIGHGKKHDKFDNIIRVSICMEDAKQFISEYNGKHYLNFDLAEKKSVDQYGKSHSASVWEPDAEQAPESSTSWEDAVPDTGW